MSGEKIADLRAYYLEGGADYHSKHADHWIVGRIATPMSRYAEFRDNRHSWGIGVLGSVVAEVETSDGAIGVGVSTGGLPAAWIIEKHLSRFVLGKTVDQLELIWDQMFRATLFYGRKGIVMHAISAVDLALWDLLGWINQTPVYKLIGGAVRDHIEFYATTPRPDIAKKMGFIGAKMPLIYSPWDGEEGFRKNVSNFIEMRERVGEDFMLMYDCWMSLDLAYAYRLVNALRPHGLKWIEECFYPDDYWSYAALRRAISPSVLVASGEHEYTRYGFRMLLEKECVDIVQPDLTWCGGLTEALKIAALSEAYHALIIPHGSSVYSYHFVITRSNSPFAEFLIMSPDASTSIPMFHPLLLGEPVPENGSLRLPNKPGFGVELNRSLPLKRP
ncbi:MAG: L-rhamnonate dehydratase [Candidatus Bathyarchaeia archaeon]